MAISNQDAKTLMGMIPVLVEWIRYKFPSDAGELLLGMVDKSTGATSGKALKALFLLNRDKPNWTMNMLRDILADDKLKEQDTWPQSVWLILQSVRGQLVNEHTFEGLEESSEKLDDNASAEAVAKELSLSLARASYLSYHILESLAFLVRDLCEDSDAAAQKLGPKILLAKKLEKSKGPVASKIMGFLVKHCEVLFGEVNCVKEFGSRKRDKKLKVVKKLTEDEIRGAKLSDFYRIVDAAMLGIEADLLKHFYLEDIARGLYVKYSCVPSGWVEELSKMEEVKDWFTPEILTENSMEIQSKKPRSKVYKPPNSRPKSEYAADEVVDSEIVYYNKMNAFIKKYIATVKEYSSKASTEELKEMLMEEPEINKYFGDEFRNILSDTEHLLKELEPVNLVRVPRTKGVMGRPGIVGEVMLRNAEKLKKTYVPYNGMFPATRRFVHARVVLSEQKNKNKKKKKHIDFIDLWNKISSNDDYMAGLTVETMIMEPIQRYPRYVILMKGMMKEVQKEKGGDTEEFKIIEKGWKFFDSMTQELDQSIRRQEKIEEMKGSAEVVEAKNRRQQKARSRNVKS